MVCNCHNSFNFLKISFPFPLPLPLCILCCILWAAQLCFISHLIKNLLLTRDTQHMGMYMCYIYMYVYGIYICGSMDLGVVAPAACCCPPLSRQLDSVFYVSLSLFNCSFKTRKKKHIHEQISYYLRGNTPLAREAREEAGDEEEEANARQANCKCAELVEHTLLDLTLYLPGYLNYLINCAACSCCC